MNRCLQEADIHERMTKGKTTPILRDKKKQKKKNKKTKKQNPSPPKLGRARHVGHYRRNKDKIISDGPRRTPSHGRVSVGRSRRNYLQQFCTDTRCSLEELLGAMDDRGVWRDRERERERVCQGNPCKLRDFMIRMMSSSNTSGSSNDKHISNSISNNNWSTSINKRCRDNKNSNNNSKNSNSRNYNDSWSCYNSNRMRKRLAIFLIMSIIIISYSTSFRSYASLGISLHYYYNYFTS